MKFKALIDGVHFDPKKGTVKIVLVGASHVSLDELTTLSSKDETIQVILESEQTKLDYEPRPRTDTITLSEEEAVKLKEAAHRLKEGDEDGSPEESEAELKEGRIITEFPTSAADGGEEGTDGS